MREGLIKVEGWQNPRYFLYIPLLESLVFQIFSSVCQCVGCYERFEAFHDSLHRHGVAHEFAEEPGMIIIRIRADETPLELLSKLLERDLEEVALPNPTGILEGADLLLGATAGLVN
jgi:hypothetical protein